VVTSPHAWTRRRRRRRGRRLHGAFALPCEAMQIDACRAQAHTSPQLLTAQAARMQD
jgi:hypothetical protein